MNPKPPGRFPFVQPHVVAWNLLMCLLLGVFCATSFGAEDFAAAVAAGKVSVRIHGTGGSTGDSIEVVVTKTDKSAGTLELTIPAGTRLQSGNSSAQSMVVASVKGQKVNERSYSPSTVIEVGDKPETYILDAYCAEFEKDNPSPTTKFAIGKVDPVLACILTEAASLSPSAKQAAVWIYTDKASFSHVNQKFSVSKTDWDAAQAVVRKCQAKQGEEKKATPKKKRER